LLIGALDPLYPDPGWYTDFAFDKPGPSYTDATAQAQGPLCPFDADYAPAFLNGFGCDVQTLSPRIQYEPVRAEYESLSMIDRQIKQYRDDATALKDVQTQIDQLSGHETVATPAPGPYEHKMAYGCGWFGGYCKNEQTKRCVKDSDCNSNDTCETATKVCKLNRVVHCSIDAQCGSAGPCVDDDTPLSTRSVRSPFSADKDETSLLMEFLGVRTAEEVSREFSDELKTSAEFSSGSQQQKDRASDEDNPFGNVLRQTTRALTRTWSLIQGRSEALIFPAAVDGQLQIADALTGLRSAVAKLAKLAVQREDTQNNQPQKGLRDFVMSYAYFIRRTCNFRPCNLLLERVMRITGTDECFPYTNGEFLNDDDSDPRWKKCAEKAGIN
jgi:hypothetical protein